jgi:S1-C subfamily serine protease
VRFFDGSTASASVSAQQPERDLAVIQVRRMPNGAQAATLAGGIRQGDKVMAIGSPFGLEGSVSSGIVSATGRSFVVEETGQVLQNMVQFDAAVNPGSSGGPLVDFNGRVVGIVTGIINPAGDRTFVGLGFATPIESASGIIPPLG